jgi:sugar/nucleoside kinase (ribokinase family)
MIMQPSKPYDVLTFGDMCVDLIVTGDDVVPQFGQVEKLVGEYELEMGGSCNIFACQLAKLGLRVGVIGRLGDDDFGRLVLRRLTESGVDVQNVIVDPKLKTGLGIALCQGPDRAILTYLGSLNAVFQEDLSDELLQSAHHLHHGSFFLQTNLLPAIPGIFARARSFGLSTSLDTNWDPTEKWDGSLQDTLPLTDIFLPNEQEARLISRTFSVDEAIQVFQGMGVAIIAVKQGTKGALVVSQSERHTCVLPVVIGGDSIGTGDSFDAGFLAGWLRGLSLEQCLQIASHCGREVAAQTGGIRSQPNWKTVTQMAGIKNQSVSEIENLE